MKRPNILFGNLIRIARGYTCRPMATSGSVPPPSSSEIGPSESTTPDSPEARRPRLERLSSQSRPPPPPLVVVMGATATGKSTLALALAERFGGEIINCDSIQVYKGLDIVTNKVTSREQARVRHHLLDFVDPLKRFTVVDFRNQAVPLVEELLSRGTLPILCGGTNYYVESILWEQLITECPQEPPTDTDPLLLEEDAKILKLNPKADESNLSRDTIFLEPIVPERYDHVDSRRLHAILAEVDDWSALHTHPQNRRKILRCLQVYQSTGRPYSELLAEQRSATGGNSYGGPLRFENCIIFWVNSDMAVLDERINGRVDQMLSEGLLQELVAFHEDYNKERRLRNEAPNYSQGIFQTIGFKEFHEYLTAPKDDNDDDEKSSISRSASLLVKSINQMKQRTRRYARKQLKWTRLRLLTARDRRVPPIVRLDSTDKSKFHDNCIAPAIEVIESILSYGSLASVTSFVSDPRMEVVLKSVEECPESGGEGGGGSRDMERNRIYHCDVCDRPILGAKMYKEHLASRAHRLVRVAKKMAELKEQEQQEAQRGRSQESGDKKQSDLLSSNFSRT